MPQTYQCDICHEVASDFMITNVHDGTTVAVGVECLLEFAVPLVEAFAAAQAHDETTGPQEAGEAPTEGDGWEEGYPQGRPDGAVETAEGGEAAESTPEQSTPAADVPS